MKTEIMRLANRLVESLLFCDDEEFVNSVLERVNDGTVFDEDEIGRRQTMNEIEKAIKFFEESLVGAIVFGDAELVEVNKIALAALRKELEAHRNEPLTWISVKDRLPEPDVFVLVIVSGKPKKNITLKDAIELAEYDPEGWALEMWPEWMEAKVTHWMHLPEPPAAGGADHA